MFDLVNTRKMEQGFKAVFVGLMVAVFVVCLACDKDEPTASVSFDPPGIYKGTYYVLRDWQSPEYEDTSLAYVTFDFKGDLTFLMSRDSPATWSEFDLCSVEGTYLYRNNVLTLDTTKPHPNAGEICDPRMAPVGAFDQNIVNDILVFWLGDATNNIYRKLELKPQ